VVEPIVVHARRTPRFLSSTSRLGRRRIAINSQFKPHSPIVLLIMEFARAGYLYNPNTESTWT
jgi:hypothetical protein